MRRRDGVDSDDDLFTSPSKAGKVDSSGVKSKLVDVQLDDKPKKDPKSAPARVQLQDVNIGNLLPESEPKVEQYEPEKDSTGRLLLKSGMDPGVILERYADLCNFTDDSLIIAWEIKSYGCEWNEM